MYKIPAATLFLGKKLIILPKCPSTNSVATELSQNSNLAEGTVVITNHQLEGRGQRGNTWESQPGKNLTFSVILNPVFLKAQDQFLLNQVVSLGVKDALVEYFPHTVKIKWPNDIMVNSKKVCGILIENQVNGIYLHRAVVGIGLNVNQEKFNVVAASSILREFGQSLSLNDLLEKVIKAIEVRYLQLKHDQMASLKEDYLKALFWRNEKHPFASEGKRFEGAITAIDEIGRLVVETDQEMKTFGFNEITFLYE